MSRAADRLEALRLRSVPVTACHAPSVSMYLDQKGDVRACCMNSLFPMGNIGEQRLADIWHGERAEQLRSALASDDYRLGCHACEQEVVRGNDDLVFARLFDNLSNRHEPLWPKQIEFAVSNTCNLQCVMCRGEWSSSIRLHREKLPPLPAVYGDQFFEDLRDFLPHLDVAKFLGGEPFLQRETYRIWELMEEVAPDTPCFVTTNGTQWNRKVEAVLESLPVSIVVSLDGFHRETYESVRQGADHAQVMANVQRFREYTGRRGTRMNLSMCLMTNNWWDLAPLLRFANELDAGFFVNTVPEPEEFDLEKLDADELGHVVDEMERQGDAVLADMGRHRTIWDHQIHRLRSLVEAKREGTEVFIGASGQQSGPTSLAQPVVESIDEARSLAAELGEVVAEVVLSQDERIVSVDGHQPLARELGRYEGHPAVEVEPILLQGGSFAVGPAPNPDVTVLHRRSAASDEQLTLVTGKGTLPRTDVRGAVTFVVVDGA